MSFLQIRFIEDLRDIYKNREIWIIGTGKSLDDFSDDFFDDKISITLNWALLRFPNSSYCHGHHENIREYLRDKKPELLEKSIIPYPFPGPFYHKRILDPIEFFGDLTSVPIWMNFRDTRPIPRSLLEETVRGIMEKKTDVRYHASMSVAHTAIECAAIMGAKKITLVGCEHRIFQGGKGRGEKGNISAISIPYNIDKRVADGTNWLAELFGEYGVEVQRFYNNDTGFYKKGYEKI
jgi:hypothetical protein